GGGVSGRLGGDFAGRASLILDDKLLTEPLRQPLSYQACHDVSGTSGGKSDNDAHRPRRIAFRPSDPRHGWQRRSAGGQMQKLAAAKFHVEPPFTSFDHLVGAQTRTFLIRLLLAVVPDIGCELPVASDLLP